MTLREIKTLRERLFNEYRLVVATKNIVILNFQNEFNRHVKLICKKQDPKLLPVNHELRIALRESLRKSRNMKRFQKEMTDAKNRIQDIQIRFKESKLCFRETQRELSMNHKNSMRSVKMDYRG